MPNNKELITRKELRLLIKEALCGIDFEIGTAHPDDHEMLEEIKAEILKIKKEHNIRL